MTSRKPAGESWESFVDRRIREAQERGDFDDLPGTGRPLDLGRQRDDAWWVRRTLRDEGLSYLPPALQARKDLEVAREQIARATSERAVRALVADLNRRIREARDAALQGPAFSVMPLDEETAVREWRARRGDEG